MPWWSWVWVAVMLALSVGGAGMDLRDREPVWFGALNIVSGLACVVFVLNFYGVLRLGDLTLPACAAFVAVLYEWWRDVQRDEEMTTGQRVLVLAITVALFGPAIVLGALGAGT